MTEKTESIARESGRPDRPMRPDLPGSSDGSDRPARPMARDAAADASMQSPLDALKSVAFADGDIAVETVEAARPGPHRASPLGIAVQLVKVVLILLIVMVGLIFSALSDGIGQSDGDGRIVVIATGASLVIALIISIVSFVLSWYVSTWELADDGLVLRSGLIVRKQRRIPYQRVHSVDLSASVVERILGLTSLRVDTGASEAGADNGVKFMRRAEAEALKRALFARRVLVSKQGAAEGGAAVTGLADGALGGAACVAGLSDAACVDASADVSYEMQLPNDQYVRAAVSDFNLGAALVSVLAAAGAAFQFFGDVMALLFLDKLELMVAEALEDAAEAAMRFDAWTVLPAVAAFVASFAVVLVVLTWVISTVLALVRWGGFIVRRRGNRIEVTAGLLSRSTRAVELGRIQSVSVEQSPIRRAMGYVQVVVHTVGSLGSENGGASSLERVVLHPCIKRGDLRAFLTETLPEFAEVAAAVEGAARPGAAVEPPELRRLPGAALRRTLLRGVYWTLLFVGCAALLTWQLTGLPTEGNPVLETAVWVAVDTLWVLLALGCPIMFAVRILAWRIRRIGIAGSMLIVVDGGVYRRAHYVARPKIQSCGRRVTPFQAHARVATVSVRTACATATADPRLRDVAAADADEVMAWVRPHYDNAAQADEALRAAGVL